MARAQLGGKRVTPEAVAKWKQEHGYDRPLFWNSEAPTLTQKLSRTVFFDKSIRLFAFEFGTSDQGRDIGFDIRTRMWPSLALALPVFVIGLALYVTFALVLALFRGSALDVTGVVVCVFLMSISSLFYIIGGQYLIGKLLSLVPISGYGAGSDAWRFLILPVVIGVFGGVGASTRWYRTIFLEEMNREYVRTARAKGLSEWRVLFGHVLQNAMIPVLTGVVVAIPALFIGSLISEAFFAIPGLGSYTIDAIQGQDFAALRAIVFLGAALYILGLLLTDLSYTWADPRVRLG